MGKAVQLRQRVKRFLDGNVDLNISFADLEKFLSKHFVMASETFADYQRGQVSKKRLYTICAMKICSLLCAVRYMTSSLVNTDLVSVQLMADPHYLLGYKRINSFMLSSAIIIANLMIGGLFLYLEKNGRLNVLAFFNDIEHKHPEIYPLNDYFYRKFCLKKNFLTKYALNSAMFWPNIVLNVVYFFGLTLAAYLDPSKNFMIVTIIFWDICTFVWLMDLFAVIMGGFSYLFLSSLFVKYQFIQLDREIKRCVHSRDLQGLNRAIVDHNRISVSTHKLNSMFRIVMFIVFKFVKAPLNGLLYISHAPDTNIYAQMVMVVLLLVCTSILYTVNKISASVTKWAHNSYNSMYSVMTFSNLYPRYKLKIQSFIERLSGPAIAIYNRMDN